MAKETKFGYGFLLAGTGLPYLIDKLLGPVLALIVASACMLGGIGFLLAGHLQRDKNEIRMRRGPMATIGMFALIGSVSGGVVGSLTGAIWNIAHKNRASESQPLPVPPNPPPPLRRPIAAQADMLWNWIEQTIALTKTNEMWLSQIFQNQLDHIPAGPEVDVPAALKNLASEGKVQILELASRPYRTWWGEIFQEDIRFIAPEAVRTQPQQQPESKTVSKAAPLTNLTLHDLYLKDFHDWSTSMRKTIAIAVPNGEPVNVETFVAAENDPPSKVMGFYVGPEYYTYAICVALADQQTDVLKWYDSSHNSALNKVPGDSDISSTDSIAFSGLVYIYIDFDFTAEQKGELTKLYKGKGLILRLRSSDYLAFNRQKAAGNDH